MSAIIDSFISPPLSFSFSLPLTMLQHYFLPKLSSLKILFFLLIYFLRSSSTSPVAAEAALSDTDARALLDFKTAADPADRLAFSPSSDHCLWPGVSCSSAGRVARLLLDSLGLSGAVPDGPLGRLDQLVVLNLANNSLGGGLPAAGLARLSILRVLDLSFNRFAGPIPPSLAALDGLAVLRLDGNQLNGSIPAFNQSSLKSFNVSGNDLSGAIPVTTVLASVDSSAFADNPGLCGALVHKECDQYTFFPSRGSAPTAAASPPPATTADPLGGTFLPGPASPTRATRKKLGVAVGFLVGAIALIGIFAASLLMKKKRRPRQQSQTQMPEKNTTPNSVPSISETTAESYNLEDIENASNELDSAAELAMAMSEERVKRMGKNGCLVFCAGEEPLYNLEQLMRASAEMLGRGSLGSTYKALLDTRFAVSVKRLDKKKLGAAAKEHFEEHMDRVGSLRHSNLVPLRAYFRANEERLLVYDYEPNGSLFSLIHGSKSTRARPLHWTSCLKIADDIVQGLLYIHQASRLVHGNVKSSNILLGSDFRACLTDNCLSFFLDPANNKNDPGYKSPEVQKSNQLTPSSDIYAFGVLLLELLTGKPPSQHPVLTCDLPVWVRSVRDDEACDERLLMIIDIAVACTHSSPESRPTTWDVLKMIQEVKAAETQDIDLDSMSIS